MTTSTHTPRDHDRVFEALANKHRREIIYVLGLQPHIDARPPRLADAVPHVLGSEEETLENYARYLGVGQQGEREKQ